MFDYRGDKALVDHDSGLGWILLRTEISQRMKSHAVRPCARRRRRGCPFPGPPCRPGRRRTCVYGRNELHPSRHGHLTGLGGIRTPRAEGGAGTARTAPSTPFRSEILQSSYSTSEDEISMRKNIHTAHKRHNSRINDKTTASATYKNRSHTSTTQPGCGTSPRNDGGMARARRARRGFTAAYSTPSESMKGKRTAWTRSAFMRWPPSKVCDMPG